MGLVSPTATASRPVPMRTRRKRGVVSDGANFPGAPRVSAIAHRGDASAKARIHEIQRNFRNIFRYFFSKKSAVSAVRHMNNCHKSSRRVATGIDGVECIRDLRVHRRSPRLARRHFLSDCLGGKFYVSIFSPRLWPRRSPRTIDSPDPIGNLGYPSRAQLATEFFCNFHLQIKLTVLHSR